MSEMTLWAVLLCIAIVKQKREQKIEKNKKKDGLRRKLGFTEHNIMMLSE